ncbi:hypothetical protein [Chryseobacterium paridis]|uniref:Uncharacterized protein n=1 Tax=Chryseobacterium paridis TaxID=2800328 RepID=A0ABS1FUG4_9FLAO|nr:hypothetical protein [Chryseobacterium paridis]MBK1896054.1 hypothetical protein [Chryseobacterium paridis]
MDEFCLSPKEVYQILKNKGVKFLHHANTVSTSITFIKNRALLSRHFVEKNGLHQTSQKSDEEDKKFDVWDYIFLDGEDLHTRYSRANKYGPIIFRFRLDMLTSPSIKGVYVTKSNPWYWSVNTPPENRYYKAIEELNSDYLTGKKLDSQIMFTIKSPEKEIKLNKFLHSIGVDIPKLLIKIKHDQEIHVGDYAFEVIQRSLQENGLSHIPLLKRHNGNLNFCSCHANYNKLYLFNYEEFKKRFSAKQ